MWSNRRNAKVRSGLPGRSYFESQRQDAWRTAFGVPFGSRGVDGKPPAPGPDGFRHGCGGSDALGGRLASGGRRRSSRRRRRGPPARWRERVRALRAAGRSSNAMAPERIDREQERDGVGREIRGDAHDVAGRHARGAPARFPSAPRSSSNAVYVKLHRHSTGARCDRRIPGDDRRTRPASTARDSAQVKHLPRDEVTVRREEEIDRIRDVAERTHPLDGLMLDQLIDLFARNAADEDPSRSGSAPARSR